jgi:hypothetical protein
MTSTFDTRVNFTMKDVSARVQKLQAILHIKYVLRHKLEFPKNSSFNHNFQLVLEEYQVTDILYRARLEAESECNKFGMNVHNDTSLMDIDSTHEETVSKKNSFKLGDNAENKVLESLADNQEAIQLLKIEDEFEYQDLTYSNEISGKFLSIFYIENLVIFYKLANF